MTILRTLYISADNLFGVDMPKKFAITAGLFVLAIIFIIYALYIEPNQLHIQYETINQKSGSSLVIMQISDLHIRKIRPVHHQIIEAIKSNRPDIVVLTGDVLDNIQSIDTLECFLKMIPKDVKIFAVMGNWEYWSGLTAATLSQFYAANNVTLLVNQTVATVRNTDTILITGLDDLLAGEPSLDEALKSTPPAANHIIIAHSPLDYIEQQRHNYDALKIPRSVPDLYHIAAIFTGHTHGGQVTLWGRPIFTPPGSNGYFKGWYRDKTLYVSKGVGMSTLPVRFMAKPEIVIFNWYLK